MKSSPLDTLYPYQRDAKNATYAADKGIICLPTGTGKTYIQAAIVADDVIQEGGFKIFVVNAPRILLSYQLLREFYGFITKCGVECRYMFVHSGGPSDETELENLREEANNEGHNIPFSQIESGISVDKIANMITKAKMQNLPVVFFSTYNSADKIEIARQRVCKDTPIKIVLNDESHYLIQEQFHDILRILTAEKTYFFTATTIHTPSDKGRGMNNVELYGEVLYSMTPRTAIDMGKMVRPRLHIVTTPGVYNSDDYQKSLTKIIKESYIQHSVILGDKIGAKMLVSVKGTLDIKRFLASDEYTELRNEGVSIYAVACHEDIKNDINGEKTSRSEFLKRLRKDGKDNDKKLIVFHYDTMAEGIDVTGFTGILPLRSLNKSKFLQTFGRSARLHDLDRKRISDGTLDVNQLESYVKPYAYVIIPDITNSNEDDKANLTSLITELRSYNFKPYENIVSVSYTNGIPEVDTLSGLNNLNRRFPNIGTVVNNLEAEVESEENAKLTKKGFLEKISGLFK